MLRKIFFILRVEGKILRWSRFFKQLGVNKRAVHETQIAHVMMLSVAMVRMDGALAKYF